MKIEKKRKIIPECFGERHVFVLMSFLAIAINYAMRFTLPIGIVAMVTKGAESRELAFCLTPQYCNSCVFRFTIQ